MKYISTRNTNPKNADCKSSAEVIIKGIADDGGLFVPTEIPKIDNDFITSLCKMDYPHRAAEILKLYLTDFSYDELLKACTESYASEKFGTEPASVKKVGDNNILELWHGPTKAFKDMALQLLPRLLSLSLGKTGIKEDALILVATSGDTGKAALEGYADIDRVKIIVFYPNDGVSNMQKRQMVTQKGNNICVVAINGNFDDAQSGVKKIFSDRAISDELLNKGIFLSSANSINWGRLAPQIVYYFSAYCDLVNNKTIKMGDVIDVTVPTGNFGNILAAYIAGQMGLPTGTLVCATNNNKILADYFSNGSYDKRRNFYTTVSPSMDILISSNLERLLCLTYGTEFCKNNMSFFCENSYFETDKNKNPLIFEKFAGISCNEDQTKETIAKYFSDYSYLLDPHTAVAIYCADLYKKENKSTNKMLVVSTASPYKFPYAVAESLGVENCKDEFECLEMLEKKSGIKIPEAISGLKTENIRFRETISSNDMAKRVLEFSFK
ncbi:MAG: threonine synthase [Clostridiales bacterium GWF2_38_85]|nr:MAG: threonine synthase [Clostridiales bacterium GWF2_38_85]